MSRMTEVLFLGTSAGSFAALLAIFVHPDPPDLAMRAAIFLGAGIPISVFAYFRAEETQLLTSKRVARIYATTAAALAVTGQSLLIAGFVLLISAIHIVAGLVFGLTSALALGGNLLFYFRYLRHEKSSFDGDTEQLGQADRERPLRGSRRLTSAVRHPEC